MADDFLDGIGCVTHHHACDCREARFEKIRAEWARWRDMVEQSGDDGVGLCVCGRCYLDGPEKYAALLTEVERLQANDDALKSVCAHAAVVLAQLEFADHEAEDESLTQRLIEVLTVAAGGEHAVKALLDDRTENA